MLRRKFSITTGANYAINIDNYLTIEALEDGLTAKLSKNACEYCIDGDGVWMSLPANTETESINSGQILSFRANITPANYSGIGSFTISKNCNLLGNCMSMLFGDNAESNFSLMNKNYAFYQLFYNCDYINEVSENFCPATTLSPYCYKYMFYSVGLRKAPKLPATTLYEGCYDSMFAYNGKLSEAPELPATRLVSKCYQSMFSSCFGLKYIKALFLTTPGTNYTRYWVSGVNTKDGIFVKNKDATWDVTGSEGIPKGWTVVNDGDITFTVNGTRYYAEEGMTWEEWINSEYNTDGFTAEGNIVNYGTSILTDNYRMLMKTELIINEHAYILMD